MDKRVLNFEELLANGEMTPIPGFSPEMYLCHCPSGSVYSLLSGKWLLQDNPNGTGDNNKYLMTTLKGLDGKYHRMYLHEILMSSFMGIKKSEWVKMGLQVDHIDRNPRNNKIKNLRLTSDVGNKKNSRDRYWNKVRLSHEIAQELREEFNSWTGSKIKFYKNKAKELGVTSRSIQNIILGYTYNKSA